MKIMIAVDKYAWVGVHGGPSIPSMQVATKLQNDLPKLLANITRQLPRDTSPILEVEVERAEFADGPADPSIWIKVTDFPETIHDVQIMPYDKVWHAIIDWFTDNGWLFPASSFRYDTGNHGMFNVNNVYHCW